MPILFVIDSRGTSRRVVPRGLATDLAQMLLSRDHPFTIWAVG